MKKINKVLGICILSAISFTNILAQTTIDGEFRPRIEFRDGVKKPLTDTLKPDYITLQRTRLSANYKSGILNTQLTLQDSYVWGQTDTKSVTTIGVYEAWVELLLIKDFSATIGRQAIKYDDQRIFSVSNWTNSGQAHDLVLFKYKVSKLKTHLGLAYNNSKDTTLEIDYTVKLYKNMEFTWLSYDFDKGLTFSAIAIDEGMQKTTNYTNTYFRNTIGSNLVFTNDSMPFNFKLCGYYQFGRSNVYDTAKLAKNSTFANLNAYMIAAKISYKFFNPLQIFAGTDIYSGSSYSAPNNKSTTFNKLYGSNHTFNGYMEYWYNLPKAGLKDFYFGLNSQLINSLSAEINYHIFSLYRNYQYTDSKKIKTVLSPNLGSELDFTFLYKLSSETTIQGGYSIYFKNNNTEKVLKTFGSSTRMPQWAYIMLTIRPVLYKSKDSIMN
jgi:hypothetical protein